ncbi:M28 family metallopeptidase [Chengkuizengella axinellae]|uniref:M20/M25/M40 family metallo-hydrolase n=1 Tax=Chengkuizengella axinellae TaxID=3064388 RepID=A0ABT9J3A0_9BACL|nr:M20/M25/M40 family metallo-hydrolase [Chengkuizengella sp. 2205SS18-9]MDP5275490.1 M20/M25/M40 family metallo-hydrolase [Chengkuizengella sp. 2205SS18-9]
MKQINESIYHHIRKLSEIESRNYTAAGNGRAKNYIVDELNKIGYEVIYHEFDYEKETYLNLIANTNVESKINYIVCAHFDSISNEALAPGADDNASGVAALLELAKIIKTKKYEFNVQFIFFNLEEEGAIGSKSLAKQYFDAGEKIEGVINLDTIGTWDGPISEQYPLTYVTNEASQIFMDEILAHFPLPLQKCEDLWTDDHGSFWEYGYKAIELTELGCTKYMHTDKDTIEKLNCDNIGLIVNGLVTVFDRFSESGGQL